VNYSFKLKLQRISDDMMPILLKKHFKVYFLFEISVSQEQTNPLRSTQMLIMGSYDHHMIMAVLIARGR